MQQQFYINKMNNLSSPNVQSNIDSSSRIFNPSAYYLDCQPQNHQKQTQKYHSNSEPNNQKHISFQVNDSIQIETSEKFINNTPAKIQKKQLSHGFEHTLISQSDYFSNKKRNPRRKRPLFHLKILLSTAFLLLGIVIFILFSLGIVIVFPSIVVVFILSISYSIYVTSTFAFMSQETYHQQQIDRYKEIYKEMVNGKGYINFIIQNYCLKKNIEGRNYFPNECYDQSGELEEINLNSEYVIITYKKKFYFSNEQSHNNFKKEWNDFLEFNRIGNKLKYFSHTLEIENCEQAIIYRKGYNPFKFNIIQVLLAIIGLYALVAWVKERYILRYEITIVKRLEY